MNNNTACGQSVVVSAPEGIVIAVIDGYDEIGVTAVALGIRYDAEWEAVRMMTLGDEVNFGGLADWVMKVASL